MQNSTCDEQTWEIVDERYKNSSSLSLNSSFIDCNSMACFVTEIRSFINFGNVNRGHVYQMILLVVGRKNRKNFFVDDVFISMCIIEWV